MRLSTLLVAAFIAICLAGECSQTNCGNPPCAQCITTNLATFWKDCGSLNAWETVPAGTPVLRYNYGTPCSACTSDRVNSRIISGSSWGFFAIGDLGNCTPFGTETAINETLVGCPAPGAHSVVQAQTLRGQPEGIQCGMLQPGQDIFKMVKSDPTCSWCYGQASGPVCNDVGAPCAGCWGWTECIAM